MPEQGRLKDKSFAPADAHGCGACPHPVTGPAIKGSSNVFVNSLPALRVGDNGVHSACCGPNIWTAVKGSATVFINGRAAHRMGDQDQHCGGIGNLIEGSPNVIVGDSGAGGAAAGVGAGDVPSELACIQAQTLREAAKSGVPFCEKCKKNDDLSSNNPDSDKVKEAAVSDKNTTDKDDSKYCIDIHCHPILIPFHQNKEEKLSKINLCEESDDPQWFDKIVSEDILGLAAYTQSDFKKLAKGKVRVAFVSLTPIEYGFMTMPLLTNITKAYKIDIIRELISPSHDYFDYLQKEYEVLTNHQKDVGQIDGKKFKYKLVKDYKELKGLLYIGDDYKLDLNKNIYHPATGELSGKRIAFNSELLKLISKLISEDQVNNIAVVLTVEGGHTLGCGQKNTIFYKITDQSLEEFSETILKQIYKDYFGRIAPKVVPELVELLGGKQTIKNIAYILGYILYKNDLDKTTIKTLIPEIFKLNINSLNPREFILSISSFLSKRSTIDKLNKMNLEKEEKAAIIFINDLKKFVDEYIKLERIKNIPKQGETTFLKFIQTTIGYEMDKKHEELIINISKSCDEDFEKSNSEIEDCKEKLWKTLEDHITTLKSWNPLFITLNHHFWNQLSGHSMTIPSALKIPVLYSGGITKEMRKNQVLGMNRGFTELGKKVVKKLLDNKDGKRRILIDTKHMSITSRIWYYTYLGYIEADEQFTDEVRNDSIPIISSHSAVNGYKTMKESKEGNDGTPPLIAYAESGKKYKKKIMKESKEGNDDTTYKAYAVADNKYKIGKKYNKWDMNLSDEEIKIIYKSKGLIGINFDQRVSGGKNDGKNKINRIVNNILHIKNVAESIPNCDCWSCITIGTDFDGSINPINDFRTAEDFANLEKALKENFKDDDVVDRIMYRNAMKFLEENFFQIIR